MSLIFLSFPCCLNVSEVLQGAKAGPLWRPEQGVVLPSHPRVELACRKRATGYGGACSMSMDAWSRGCLWLESLFWHFKFERKHITAPCHNFRCMKKPFLSGNLFSFLQGSSHEAIISIIRKVKYRIIPMTRKHGCDLAQSYDCSSSSNQSTTSWIQICDILSSPDFANAMKQIWQCLEKQEVWRCYDSWNLKTVSNILTN